MINLTIGSIKHQECRLGEDKVFFSLEIFNKNVVTRLNLFLLGKLQNKMLAISISKGFLCL